MSRDEINRALGECPDCYALGHICRPCRKARYEARQATDAGMAAGLVVVYFSIGLLALVVAAVWAVTRG